LGHDEDGDEFESWTPIKIFAHCPVKWALDAWKEAHYFQASSDEVLFSINAP
jgi:hypothetical protein